MVLRTTAIVNRPWSVVGRVIHTQIFIVTAPIWNEGVEKIWQVPSITVPDFWCLQAHSCECQSSCSLSYQLSIEGRLYTQAVIDQGAKSSWGGNNGIFEGKQAAKKSLP